MIINLFSGSGAGKSTIAAKLYADLKILGYSVELVQEYVKKWAYLGRKPISHDQVYIFGKQLHAEDHLLYSGVKVIVTDSPILMGCAYAKIHNSLIWEELTKLAKKIKRDTIDIFLEREGIPFQSIGRYENEHKALEMDCYIKEFLKEHLDKQLFCLKTVEYPKILDLVVNACRNL